MRRWELLLAVVACSAGCNAGSEATTSTSAVVSSAGIAEPVTVSPAEDSAAQLVVIDGRGIGDIHLGDSLQSLVDEGLLSPDLQDSCTWVAPGLRWQTEMLLPPGMSGYADIDKQNGDVVSIIDVYGTGWRTAEGALPGMSLAELSDLYPAGEFEEYLGTGLLRVQSDGGPMDLVLDGSDHLASVAVPGLWYCD